MQTSGEQKGGKPACAVLLGTSAFTVGNHGVQGRERRRWEQGAELIRGVESHYKLPGNSG